jgi:hypothetical protein
MEPDFGDVSDYSTVILRLKDCTSLLLVYKWRFKTRNILDKTREIKIEAAI